MAERWDRQERAGAASDWQERTDVMPPRFTVVPDVAATAGDALSDGLGGVGAAAHEALARFVPWLTPWCTRLSNSSATATAWLSRAHAEAAAAASHAAESVGVPQPVAGLLWLAFVLFLCRETMLRIQTRRLLRAHGHHHAE